MFFLYRPPQGVDTVQSQLVKEMVLAVVGHAPVYRRQVHFPSDPYKGQRCSHYEVYELIGPRASVAQCPSLSTNDG